jgi:ABC-type multidrug transport system fused ATPase/permease subunit
MFGHRRNVSFKYPGTDNYALNDISFKIEPGQLCVRGVKTLADITNEHFHMQIIVGTNGSGWSPLAYDTNAFLTFDYFFEAKAQF